MTTRAHASSGTLSASRRSWEGISFRVGAAVITLLLIFTVQNLIEMGQESSTYDEVAHLPAGYTYLVKRDFRLNPEHPPLLKVLSALPLLVLHPQVDFNDPSWNLPSKEYAFGAHFLYSNPPRQADRLLFWGRLPVLAIAVLLGLFIFRWSQQMYGNLAGLFAVSLFTFSPNLIAHSHLVTTDIGVTAFLTITFYFLWRYSSSREKSGLYWAALAMGAALASKYSAVVLLPVAVGLLWVTQSSRAVESSSAKATPPGTKPKKIPQAKPGGALKERGREHSSQGKSTTSSSRVNESKAVAIILFVVIASIVTQLSYVGSLDPSLYFKGLEQVNKNHRPDFLYYLHGTLKAGGWWYYFLIAFLVKASAPFILLVIARIVFFFKNWRNEWKMASFLILPTVIFFGATSALADPLGVRYLLPLFPFLMIFSSGLIRFVSGKKVIVWMLWILLGWHVVSSLASFPNHLSYFNEFVGGSSHGTEWLDDSNVDWGQGLKALKKTLDQRGIQTVTLLSFSAYDNPEYYGIHCIRPPQDEWMAILSNPQPGMYAISAHWLARAKGLGYDWKKKFPISADIGNSIYLFKVS